MDPDQTKSSSVVGLIAIAVFALWFWRPMEATQQALTSKYVQCPGTITQFEIGDDGELEKIEYSYGHQGRRYFSSTTTYYSRHELSDIEEVTGRLGRGQAINVYIDPQDPSKSVLVRGTTRMIQFGFIWCGMAGIGIAIGIARCLPSSTDWRAHFATETETVASSTTRLRLVPSAFKTPKSVAIACFVVTFALIIGHIELFRYISQALGKPGGFLDELSFATKFGSALAIATVAATFDYFYTLRGNERGRWDLSVNKETGLVNIPAYTAFGKATTVRLDQIKGLELRTVISKHESDNNRPIYRFNVVCDHECGSQPGHDSQQEHTQRVAYTVAQSTDLTELRALADWLNDSADLGLPIEASESDGTSAEQLKEIMSAQRLVKVGS